MKGLIKATIFVAVFVIGKASVLAQPDWGAAPADSGGGTSSWGSAGTDSAAAAPEANVKRPYVRFIPPYDTNRELIFYTGIIEEQLPDADGYEESSADSLYYRAKKFLAARYGKENVKKWVVEDKKGNLLNLKVTIPMLVRKSEQAKSNDGELEFKLVLRFQQARYKYQFMNFVHIKSLPGTTGKSNRTYHEAYYKNKRGAQQTDYYLKSADREVKEVVEGLTKALKSPFKPNEDDW